MSKRDSKLKAIDKQRKRVFEILVFLFLIIPIFISPIIKLIGFALSSILVVGIDHQYWFVPEKISNNLSIGLNIISISVGVFYISKFIGLHRKYVRIKNINVIKR